MENRLYSQMADLEDNHWWFVSRRKIFETVLSTHIDNLNSDFEILDAGCGTGGTIQYLSRNFPLIKGMEFNIFALEVAKQKNRNEILQGKLPDEIPFPDKSFDLILLLDVLEHLDDDVRSLRALFSKIKPNGYLLVTVPAFNFLWSNHDDVHHHKRRYCINELENKMKISGFTIKYISFFNTFLFTPIALVRVIKNNFKFFRNKEDSILPNKKINALLTALMSSEKFFLERGKLPFGVSLICLAQRIES